MCMEGGDENEETSFNEKQKSKFYNRSAAFWLDKVLTKFNQHENRYLCRYR